MWNPFSKASQFEPVFPIIPLRSTEQEARVLLERVGNVRDEEPGNDSSIATSMLVSENEETRISVGIWDQQVRFVTYLTSQFDESERKRAKKLRWFIDYYGGVDQLDEPADTGALLWLRNPEKKILIIYGLHMGPIRIIDEDADYWSK